MTILTLIDLSLNDFKTHAFHLSPFTFINPVIKFYHLLEELNGTE